MSSSMLAVEKFEEHKAHPEQKKRSLRIKHFIGDYGIVLILAVVMLVLTFTAHNFLTIDNLTNVVRQSSIVGLVAVGMTFVMITAGIDLSVGSVVGSRAFSRRWPLPPQGTPSCSLSWSAWPLAPSSASLAVRWWCGARCPSWPRWR